MDHIRLNTITNTLLTLSLIWLIFGFKIGVIPINGSLYHGVRIDDIVTVILSVILFLHVRHYHINKIKVDYFFILFVGVSLLSSTINVWIGNVGLESYLYTFRNIQYYLFFFIGYFFLNEDKFLFILKIYSVYLFLLLLFQDVGHLNINVIYTDRPSGNLGGPWEVAMVGAFLYFFFSKKRAYNFMFISILIIFISSSRIVLAGMILVFLYQLWKKNKIAFIVFSLIGLSFFLFLDFYLKERLLSVFSGNNLQVVNMYYNEISMLEMTREKYFFYAFESLDIESMSKYGDPSLYVRVYRWIYLFLLVLEQPFSLIIGLGPSFSSFAVDGNFTRVFIETGFLGVLTFILFLLSKLQYLKNINSPIFYFLFVMVITGLLLDSFVAFKPMMLFWLYIGISYNKELDKLRNYDNVYNKTK